MELLDMMLNRRSVREYTGDHIPGDKLEMILQAGLAAPSGRGRQPWEFIVVQTRDALKKLSDAGLAEAYYGHIRVLQREKLKDYFDSRIY